MPDRALALIVYESLFGNTEQLAESIYDGLRLSMRVAMVRADRAPVILPTDLDLLVVGAPTHAFGLSRPSTRVTASAQAPVVMPVEVGVREWLGRLRYRRGRTVAATFDTKVVSSHLPGSAARATAKVLHRRGYRLVVDPAHFFLENAVGPPVAGETERSIAWAEELAARMRSNAGRAAHRRTA
jgi:hypothetical protein